MQISKFYNLFPDMTLFALVQTSNIVKVTNSNCFLFNIEII